VGRIALWVRVWVMELYESRSRVNVGVEWVAVEVGFVVGRGG